MGSYIVWAVGALSALSAKLISTRGDPVANHLGPLLSPEAQIYFPGTEGFKNASVRWSSAIRPQFKAIVKVTTEEDVKNVVQFANEHNHDFLAFNGGHGTTYHLSKVKNGIGIQMAGMKGIKIVDDGKAALVQGGVQTGELGPYLWSNGKQTVTTGCDCAGFISPLLGGGHGWLQGRYGLVADQLISARMITANATAITVSREEHPDLFWGIRGAGHNFGIFTEMKIKIYDRSPEQDQWAALGLTFTHDKLEQVFGITNEWITSKNRPVELTHYGVVLNIPDIDPDHPVIILWIYYQGASIPDLYTSPLRALGPIAEDYSVTNLADVNTHLSAHYGGLACATGFSRILFPVSLDTWPLANLRSATEQLGNLSSDFASSMLMLESYATNAVGQFPSADSAFPDRGGQLLAGLLLTYPDDERLDAQGATIGREMRETLVKGTGKELVTYVNYAAGDESLESIYGYEAWRLEKLKGLKREWDPRERFSFYAPIPVV
ncbi:FAD-binding domain-containing protein [Polyplosphaeria fusca]|uniref:FAD-binding domain-containing protein n=1 Tax=Polyplosphaeria fusca TaxID=682080 RepID=A0A9P4UYT5_9PLEO|nr:FAD-binding domain-containing protein [Polyplosphaeria fusca]